MIYPKLYTKNSDGSYQYWTIELAKEKYRPIFGRVGEGYAESVGDWTQCFPKNVGKKNETNSCQQAKIEADAKWKKKLDDGAFETVEELSGDAKFVKPMLAHTYEKYGHKLQYPIIVNPKLDGVRCIASKHGIFTRTGKKLIAPVHIHNFLLANVFAYYPDLILDGELYNHKYKEDFETLTSMISKKKSENIDFQLIENNVQYHIYDFVDEKKTQIERVNFLDKMLNYIKTNIKTGPLRKVHHAIVKNKEELDEYFETSLDLGYEGSMIRAYNGMYQIDTRSQYLLKYKNFQDQEFEIVDIVQGKGKREFIAGSILCRMSDGRVFGSGIKGSFEFCKDLLDNKNKYIGKVPATIKFFKYTGDGIPRFGVLKSIRDYE